MEKNAQTQVSAQKMETADEGNARINKISIKVPPFWPDRRALWFASLEAQFHLNQITREVTKFYHTISRLDTASAGEVEDLIIKPPDVDPYTKLKDALIHRFSESYEQKVRRLLEKEEMGDRKPSSFLRHLRTLSAGGIPERLLQNIWSNRLPQQTQSILLTQPNATLEELGDLADKLQEVNPAPQVRAVISHHQPGDIERLTQLVDNLTRQVASLSASTQTRGRSFNRSHSRSRSRSRPNKEDILRPAGIAREIKHSTLHYIHTTDGPPVSCRPRRLGPVKLVAAKKEFADMVSCGTARPSKSPWSSPLHLAQKRDTSWRPCGDYRALNARTIPDRYPVRHIGDFNQALSGATIFSTIDLAKAYQQIPVYEPHICKTAIITPFGLYEHPFMGYGLRNAGQTFQRFIDEVVQGLEFCYSYVDDILVYSKNANDHSDHLRILFQRLQDYGVVVNSSKCRLGLAEVTFLGYHISPAGTKPPDDRITSLLEFPPPKTVQGMRRFLGMMNYYRKFLPSAAKHQAPLIEAVTAVNGKGAKPFPWTAELEQQFDACKKSLSSFTLLAHPDVSAPLGLFTDASSTHVGSCLQQKVDGDWQPLAFFSKKLDAKQALQPAYYRELLGVYESVQHFRHILEAQHTTIFTDHKPLLYAFEQRRERLPPQQLNHLSFISQFTTDIQHIKGSDNVVADAMSRIEAISLEPDFAALARAQEKDEELERLPTSTSLKLEKVAIPGTNISIFCDRSTGKPRPYLPGPLRRAAFDRPHNLSHPGARASARMVAERHVWPNMQKDCRAWARTCLACQRSKVSRHNSAPLGNFNLPSGRFKHVHIDIIGPLPSSNGHTYCLTAVDRFSRWPEAWPMTSITATQVAETFLSGWIARYGVPSTVTTDQGRQFESNLFHRLTSICGTTRLRTTSYHPQANGMVERLHRQLKAAIMCHTDTWYNALPVVLLGLRSSLKEDLKCSAAEIVYGEPLRLPGELVVPTGSSVNEASEFVAQLRTKMSSIRAVPASRHSKPSSFIYKDLATATHVMLRDDTVRRSLQTPYTGPYLIIKKGPKIFILQVGDREVAVSVDRVKPAHMDPASVPPTCPQQPSSNHPSIIPDPTPPPPLATPAPPSSAPEPVSTTTTRSGRRVRFKPIFDL